MAWTPILDGELAERAWESVRAIADELAALEGPSPDLALFFACLSNALEDDLTSERASVAAERFARDFERGFGGLHLHGGLTGAAWVAAHIADDVEDILADVDGVVVDALMGETWQRDYDLILGLAGYAVYLLARGAAPAVEPGLARIVHHLDALGVRTAEGVTWHTPPERLPPSQRADFPEGYYNCGVAHGVAGVIGILARISERDDAPPRAATLRDDATRWLLAQRREDGFPAMITASDRRPGRTAWCYGDPGVTLVLWDAAARARRPTIEVEAMIRTWTARPAIAINDASVCHGAAGLGHLYNRWYQATRDPAYRELARSWLERTLAMRRPGEPIAGYPMRHEHGLVPNPTIMDGAAGVALALLGGLTALEPVWDRTMLCDLVTAQ